MGNSIVVPFGFTPRPYQLEMFQALDGIEGKPETKKKRVFLRWHRRAGKDFSCLAYMVKEMVKTKGIYYYFLPNYQQGKKIVWEGISKDGFKFLDMIPKEVIARLSNQEMLIELINGSIFRVIGTDNIDTIVGTNPIGCVFSEYSLQDPRAWEFTRPILAENKGWAIFNGTPRGQNHMYELDLKVKNNKQWYYSELQTLWPDKPNYSGIIKDSIIEEERATGMEENIIEQEYGVSYSAGIKGAIYADQIQIARNENRIGSYPYDNTLPVHTFWDLGYNDPTAIWFVQFQGSAIVFIDYWEGARREMPEIVEALQSKGYRYGTHYLPHDANNNYGLLQTRRDLLDNCFQQYNMNCDIQVSGKYPIEDGINAVRARFSRYFFNEGTTVEGLDMLGRYHRRWDSKRKIYLKEPVHDWCSHCADAVRTEATVGEFTDNPFTDAKVNVIKNYDIFD